MNSKNILAIILLFCTSLHVKAQESLQDKKMEWFGDAKLGIFIHWGIYSVNGISESWGFYNNYINHDAYMKQLNGFTAAKYNPQEWADLIKESGAKYAVITTKHHDGVALWDSKAPKAITTVNNSAAKADLLTPIVNNFKKVGIKTGLYFSLPDWSYPDYDIFTRERKRYDYKAEPERWNTYLNYYQGQLKELSNQYNPDLLWFDGDWEHTSAEWQTDKVRSLLKAKNPNIIINARLDKHGDYETPEQGVPVVKPASKYWELCYTMNDSWGYQPYDNHYKSSNMIIRTLVDCMSMGGNLLLDIGPKADGTIATQQVNILKDLGRWTKKHSEAIYGTQAGIPDGHINAKTTLSKDRKKLYVYVDNQDSDGYIITGLRSKIAKVNIIGSTQPAKYKAIKPNDYLIEIPTTAYDKDVTVICIAFNEPIQLEDKKENDIDIQTLFVKNDKTTPIEKIKKLTESINQGLNPLKETNLSVDGLDFKANVNPLDSTVNNWVVKHAEALYKTQAGIPEGHYVGNTALSADKKTLYLFVEGKPTGPIAIKGLANTISRIRVVGEGTMLNHEIYNKLYWSKIPGIVYIDIPQDKLDTALTVIAVLLDSPIKLYREKVGAIESNL